MYSTRSNASPLKPMDFFAPPLIPKTDQYRAEPKTLGFGTLPSPKPMPVGISDQVYGLPIGTNGNYERQYATTDELLGREPILEPPPRPAGMHSAWQEGPDPSYMPSRGRGQVPAGYDKEAWLEQGLLVPIEEVQRQQQELLRQKAARQPDYLAQDPSGQFVPSVAPGSGAWKFNQNSPNYLQNLQEEYDHMPEDYKRSVPFEQFAAEQPSMTNLPPSVVGRDPLTDLSRKTAAMQGAPMGADDGSLVNLDDFQVPQRQPFMPDPNDPIARFGQPPAPAQGNPYMNGGQMPYPGGMSGPHMQGRMQNMLDEMLTRQQYGRQYNDMQLQRDQYDDGWDRFQADIFNPLMGALGGSRTTAAMAADSNNRRSMIQNRRNFRRQLQDDQWGQTKDLISMIAANDPQTIKNQNALAKLQMEMYQKQINAQNANTQQFGAYSNAAYKSRTAAVQEQNARTNESNMLRMLNEGADRSQQGWARINQQAGQWEQSLAMRQAELEQRQANAAQHNDQFAIQQAFREQQELNDEAYRYQKLKDDMEARAEGLNSDGSSKVSDEYRKKYGIPRKEEPNHNQQGFDLLKMLGFNQLPANSVSSTAPQTRQASPLTTPRVNKTTGGSSGQRAATSGKLLTDDVFKSLIAKYGRDVEGAKAEARRLGYRVN